MEVILQRVKSRGRCSVRETGRGYRDNVHVWVYLLEVTEGPMSPPKRDTDQHKTPGKRKCFYGWFCKLCK